MDFDINTLFTEHDSDQDGRITGDQAHNLLLALKVNIYKGTVHKIVRLMNYAQQDKNTITLQQFKEYYEAQKYKPNYDVWKAKYQLNASINQLRENVHAAPSVQDDEPVTGRVKVRIGPNIPAYENNINLHVEKKQKQQSKPFIKVVIECKDNNQATKVQQLIKQIHAGLIEILKSEEADYEKQFDAIHLITNANGNKVSVFVTTSNQGWMDLGILLSEYLDRLLGVDIDLTFDAKIGFSFDFQKFVTDPEYSFYQPLTKNCLWQIQWKGSQVMDAVRNLLLGNQFFKDLQYNPKSEEILPFILLTNTKRVNLDLEFDNLQQANGQYETKQEFVQGLIQMKEGLKSVANVGEKVLQILPFLSGKITVEGSVGNWKVNLQLDLKDANKLILSLPEQGGQIYD